MSSALSAPAHKLTQEQQTIAEFIITAESACRFAGIDFHRYSRDLIRRFLLERHGLISKGRALLRGIRITHSILTPIRSVSRPLTRSIQWASSKVGLPVSQEWFIEQLTNVVCTLLPTKPKNMVDCSDAIKVVIEQNFMHVLTYLFDDNIQNVHKVDAVGLLTEFAFALSPLAIKRIKRLVRNQLKRLVPVHMDPEYIMSPPGSRTRSQASTR